MVCLPSPNVAIEQSFNMLPLSSSFCLNPSGSTDGGSSSNQLGFAGRNQLTATDVFTNSSSLIKRPSTLMASDTMNQVAQALSSSSANPNSCKQQQQQQVPVVLRNRRQAIVPPKLTTDANQSDSETGGSQPHVGQLVELEPDDDAAGGASTPIDQLGGDEAATVRALRRKRSGGGAQQSQQLGPESTYSHMRHQQQQQQQSKPTTHVVELSASGNSQRATGRRLSGSQTTLPTFCIEPDESVCSDMLDLQAQQRPDSQMTNVDSIVSSGSSTNLSQLAGRRDFTVTSAGGLTVAFGSTRARRRSSIAVIPQMQICPGDLLVYSKQLIDRMNQSDEPEPPQFLTIDDKKNKNIWSSFKLFDTRTLKARNELLCSLEDVLASLQPSTFIDEQLSHYKGMLWNEFLYETESRRSASSEVLSVWVDNNNGNGNNDNEAADGDEEHTPEVQIQISGPGYGDELSRVMKDHHQHQADNEGPKGGSKREPVKVTQSSGHCATESATPTTGGQPATPGSHQASSQQGRPSREPAGRSLSSRFREKPKLKRGQTVDSVFRIPLIPSSPLKHAQQHQQTPTAHLEDHDLSITLEDDERSSPSSSLASFQPAAAAAAATASTPTKQTAGSTSPMREHRKGCSSSTRSRAGSATRRSEHSAQLTPSSEHHLTNGNLNHDQKHATQQKQTSHHHHHQQQPDSSFETDDAMDLIESNQKQLSGGAPGQRTTTPHQIVRQSSLSTLSSTVTRTEQKRQRALWDLFQSECAFFFDHLMTLKNVYMEPLKKIQVEGFAMFADPDVLFGNLDELCCGVYDFCKEFLYIIMRTLKTRPEELNATDVLIKLYKKNPKIDHLRGVYHRYTLNYINALTYLESLRRQVEFVEFEKWSTRDVRCKKLQLTDLLVAPVQHIMRVPIILKDIESHTENSRDRDEIRAILAVEEASLRELDDKMRWLKNFERLLEIQKNISWPSVLEMDPKLFIPEFLKDVLSKQPCEKLIVSPRRQIVHEGTLSNLDLGKACDMHVILFDDMLLLTRRKKGLTKKASTVCRVNSSGPSIKDDGSFKYIVYKHPLSLDRFYVHDVQQVDAQSIGMKHLFLLIVMNRFQQITNVHSFSAPNDDVKQTWLFKIKKTAERWKKNFANNPSEHEHHNAAAGSQPPSTHQVGSSVELAPNVVTQEPVSSTSRQATPQFHQSVVNNPRTNQAATASKRHSSEHQVVVQSPKDNDGDNVGVGSDTYAGSRMQTTSNYIMGTQARQQPIELVVTSVQSSSSPSSRDNSAYSNVTSAA